MQELHIQDWILEIDVEKTRTYYSLRRTVAETCGCTYCRNFVKACNSFPQQVNDFFSSLGIDPTKDVGEIFEYNKMRIIHIIMVVGIIL